MAQWTANPYVASSSLARGASFSHFSRLGTPFLGYCRYRVVAEQA